MSKQTCWNWPARISIVGYFSSIYIVWAWLQAIYYDFSQNLHIMSTNSNKILVIVNKKDDTTKTLLLMHHSIHMLSSTDKHWLYALRITFNRCWHFFLCTTKPHNLWWAKWYFSILRDCFLLCPSSSSNVKWLLLEQFSSNNENAHKSCDLFVFIAAIFTVVSWVADCVSPAKQRDCAIMWRDNDFFYKQG